MEDKIKTELIDKPLRMTVYTNAIKKKYKNKSTLVVHRKKDDVFILCVKNAVGKEKADIPCVIHKSHRGIRQSEIAVTRETLCSLISSAMQILNKES